MYLRKPVRKGAAGIGLMHTSGDGIHAAIGIQHVVLVQTAMILSKYDHLIQRAVS
jgi:hypothetical protein